MYIAYALITVGIWLYLAYGPGLSVLQVSTEIQGFIKNSRDGTRYPFNYRHWPTRLIVRHVWIYLMMFEYTRRKPRGIDHLKWWSPVWGFVLKLAVTAALFYGWRSEHPLPDDIHIHGKLFQYATEEWEGQHLVFLMLAIGLTFITVEKRRKDGKTCISRRE